MKTIELKARLLCEGANPKDDETVNYLSEQNPQQVLRGGLSSGLKAQIYPIGGEKSVKVNFPLYSKMPVALKVQATKSGIIILEDEKEIARAEVLKPPEWYDKTVGSYPITSILTQHGDQVVGSAYEWCSLFNTGEQCRFCVIDKSQKRPELRKISRKAELILQALEQIPRDSYAGIGLNGGMTFQEGRGLEVMVPIVAEIRRRFGEKSVGVEITPPQDLDWIEKFAEAGGESLMMNLETWNEESRQALLPGKAKYCPKDSYFRAFEKAVKVLGKGKVSTCFVIGTEPVESVKEGIQQVVAYDVIPSPLAGRYFEQFANYPFEQQANWREFLEIFRFARMQMAKAGLATTDKAGCIACGMCDIIGDDM